jgi:hypothetical protein
MSGILSHARSLCTDGRFLIAKGEKNRNPEIKRLGLKTLAEGLIQQNPLRERSNDFSYHIWGIERN